MWGVRAIVIGILIAFIALAACKQDPQADLLRIGTLDALETLDPHKRNATGSLNVIRQMYQGLVLRGRNMTLSPGLAESWENPEENLWRFRIRRGVRFHNGQPMNAYDVEASFRRLREDPDLQMAALASHISAIKVIDDFTIEITTSRLSLPTLSRLLFVYVVPRNYKDFEGQWDRMSVGTGPYRFGSWDGQTARLEPFEDYWGKRPQFTKLEFFVPPDLQPIIEKLKEGKLECAKLDGMTVPEQIKDHYDIRVTESLFVIYLAFNLMHKDMLFAAAENRALLAESIDRQNIVKDGRSGYASVTVQAVSPFVYGFNPQIRPAPPRNPHPQFPPHKPLRFLARQMFAGSATVLQQQFEKMGLHTRLTILPDTEFFQELRASNFDLFLSRWACDTADASEILESCFYTSKKRDGFGLINYTGYSSAAIDDQIDQSALVSDPNLRLRMLQELMGKVLEDHPWIPLYVNHDVHAVSKDIAWQPRMDHQINGWEFTPHR